MDSDIRRKSEVLRAQDIIPSTGSKSEQDSSTNGGVPRFDLATEIMAQQRKLTSLRRKKTENQVQTVREDFHTQLAAISAKTLALSIPAHESLIAEIVKRDIQKMLLAGGGQRS